MSKITDHPNWSYRGYIPHFDAEHKIQMITYRLADSFPQSYYKELENNLNTEKDISLQKRAFIESILDKGYGECYLRQVDFATVVRDAWLFFDKKRYDIIAFIMPNHVHIIIKTYPGFSIPSVVHSWKSFTSSKIKKMIKLKGIQPSTKFWQKEYWDRYIRDEEHYNKAINYIHENPVKAGLCKKAIEWKFSGVHVYRNSLRSNIAPSA